MGDRFLIAKTDPITHVIGEIGYYAVHINANDIAATGGTPMWYLATVMMPAHTSHDSLEQVLYEQIPISEETAALCDFYGIDPLGTFASGSLLIATDPLASREIVSRLQAHGITAARIGRFTAREEKKLFMLIPNIDPNSPLQTNASVRKLY
ncbi:MAG: AIR synthase related protein [Desulfovermiculus sp.]|nr:AIR synthase related protein [Desulfovermiculus sp.]